MPTSSSQNLIRGNDVVIEQYDYEDDYNDDESYYSSTSLEQIGSCNLFDPIQMFQDCENSSEYNASNIKEQRHLNHILFRNDINRSVSSLFRWILMLLCYGLISCNTCSRTSKSISSLERVVMVSERREIYYVSDSVINQYSGSNEMDSHTDTCCLGKNFIPLYYTGEVCNVHAFLQITCL